MSMNFTETLNAKMGNLPHSPQIFNLSSREDQERCEELFAKGEVRSVHDDFEEQLREYHAYLNPSLALSPDREGQFLQYKEKMEKEAPLWRHGNWVFFPWSGALVHIMDKEAFAHIRTSRNRNLITAEEQEMYANASIGVAGLSVGSSIALSIVLQGGADHIKLADFDRLALSNTNRVRASIVELGQNKAEATARQIYEMNPYAKVEVFSDGLTEDNASSFFEGDRKLDIVIDEIDNLAVKCMIREHAKRLGIPVLMAADNGDNGVVDIERYDQDSSMEFFHGRMGDVSYESLKGLDKMSTTRLIAKHVGPENVAGRMMDSLFEIGKTLVSWPQLGGAATLNGAAVAYCARKVACGQPLEGNRALISLDEKLIPGYMSPESVSARSAKADEFARSFGLKEVA